MESQAGGVYKIPVAAAATKFLRLYFFLFSQGERRYPQIWRIFFLSVPLNNHFPGLPLLLVVFITFLFPLAAIFFPS